jgi:hypothetical protein
MTAGDDTSNPRWDEPRESTDFQELFRYKRGEQVDVYRLRPLPSGHTELWISEYRADDDSLIRSRLERTFTEPDEAVTFLEEEEQLLRAGGWHEVIAPKQQT